jgi:hemoglobin
MSEVPVPVSAAPSPPAPPRPAANPHYEQLGGEAAVRRLVERFYQLMDELPEARAIRGMHPADLAASKERLFMFLSGWLGGPPLYAEAYGPPRLRQAHAPFPVDRAAVEAWMTCMGRALENECVAPDLKQQLLAAFRKVAEAVRNRG